MPGEITRDHLRKKLFIYVRQSSLHQVRNHVESQQIQYRLQQRGQQLGWREQDILILDEDLGVTATGVKKRQDFETLMGHLHAGDVGGIMVLTSSRLARNGREWHQVLELCPVSKALIIDSDGIYDPDVPSDRLWLGMKASFSEYEVRQLQALAHAAILNKAARGQLFHNLPPGLVLTADDRVERDPDQRVQHAVRGIFAKLAELGSIRQVYKWYHREGLEVPVRHYQNGVHLIWRVPTYATLNRILTNPLYAGIYVYPRTKTRMRIVEGRLVKSHGHRATAQDKSVLISNLFEGYLSAEQFEQNQKIIAQNTQMKGNMVSGAARDGTSLLAGLMYCGHCSRKMMVHYYAGEAGPYYFCPRDRKVADQKSCLRLSGRMLEALVSEQLLAAVKPMAIEAALLAEEKLNHAHAQKAEARAYALEQAQYEAERIERQFNATDPENRLVARTLAERWQKALEKVEALQSQRDQAVAQQQPVTDAERARLLELAADLKMVWQHPQSQGQTKRRLARLLIKQIWVQALDASQCKATIHWHGGVHTEVEFKRKPARPQLQEVKEQPAVELIRKLALICADQHIARILNRAKVTNAKGQSWCEFEITTLRKHNQIPAFSRERYEQRGLLNLEQAAEKLNLSMASVLRLIRKGMVKAHQLMKYAPWEIDETELDKPMVRSAVAALKKRQQIPFHENQQALTL